MSAAASHWSYSSCPTRPVTVTSPSRSPFRNADGSYDWEAELEYGFAAVDTQSNGSLAACIVEPILSSGGIIELPEGYLRAARELTRRHGALLVEQVEQVFHL